MIAPSTSVLTPNDLLAGVDRPPAPTASPQFYRAFWECRFLPPSALAALLLVLSGMDRGALMLSIQSLSQVLPDALWASLTMLGHGSVVFAFLALAWRFRPDWLVAAFWTLPVAGAFSHGLKAWAAAPRPAAVLPLDQLHVVGERLLAGSFPSGHTTSAFAVAAVILLAGRVPNRLAAGVLVLAVLVALSRVAVGAHWPVDVLAGAAGGWLSGAIGVYLARQSGWFFRARGQQVLAAMVLLSSGSLFFLKSGYPQGEVLQYAAAVVGCLAATRWLLGAKP